MPVVPPTPVLVSPTLLVAVVAAVIAAIIVATNLRNRRRRKRRAEEVVAFARQHGWSHEEHAPTQFLHTLPDVPPFSTGERQEVRHLLTRENVRSFEFRYWTKTTSPEDTSSQLSLHVVSMALPLPLPLVQLSTKRGAVRQGGALRFESAAFNKSWLVYSEFPQAAYDVLHPRVLEWILERRGSNIIIQDERIYSWRGGGQKVADIEAMTADLAAFVEQIPPHVWQKAQQGEYPRPQRFSPVADLGQFLTSVRQSIEDNRG